MLARLEYRNSLFQAQAFVRPVRSQCFKNKISFLQSVSTRKIRDCAAFTVNHNFEIGPSARRVFAASAVCKDVGIFNDRISLTDILQRY